MPNLLKIKNTVAVVIAHGKSELIMTEHIRSNLRLPIKIYSEKKGKQNIQIESIIKTLKTESFSTMRKFANCFSVELDKKEIVNCKIFPIMDYDNCDKQMYEDYKSGKLFEELWLAPYIVPIWSCPNLDEVLYSCGIINEKPTDRGKGKDYQKIFPINRGESDINQIKALGQAIEKCDGTNLNVFFEYCLKNIKGN